MVFNMSLFNQIKKINDYGQEYRPARLLAKALEYADFGNFENVIKKAKIACENSNQDISDHFGELAEVVQWWSWVNIEYPSYRLSRYACYLIAMEADSKKSTVALAKSYFALQTRRQELSDQYIEDQKRVELREQVSEHNKSLAKTAKQVWVHNFWSFVDYGYLGLYGMRHKEILQKKKLHPKDSLMDNISSEELAANLFRATQAEAKIKREWIFWQDKASKAHLDVGKEVRATIKRLWWTMPEYLPKTEHIKESKKRLKTISNSKSII